MSVHDKDFSYAIAVTNELTEARREIAILQDLLVTYGDSKRMMIDCHPPAIADVIERAYDRD